MDAWKEMQRAEVDSFWDRFYAEFCFYPSTQPKDFPGIREPTPSITYDVSGAYGDGPAYSRCESELGSAMLHAWRRCVREYMAIGALDWQHTCYWLFPHAPFNAEDAESWKVSAFPNGDYSIFLASDLSLGIFGHPWEETICVWGQPLLDAFEQELPTLFRHPIRRNGAKWQ